MTYYRFASGSVISEARFHVAAGRAPVALLGADISADAATLMRVRSALEEKGWQCTPVFAHGKDMVQVTGFKAPADVTVLLADMQMTVGEPQLALEPSDALSRSRKDWLDRSKLKLAGWLNAVGDVALLVDGFKHKDKFKQLTGGLYTGGALTLGLYGNVSTDRQAREAAQQTAELIQQHSGELPAGSGLSGALAQRKTGVLHRVENYLYRHPADVMLGAYTAGAAAMVGSGITQKNNQRIGYGVWSMLVKTTSFLLPEKKNEGAEEKTRSPRSVGGFVDWIREKPLRLFGYGSMVTELLLTSSAYKDFKSPNPETRASGIFGFVTAGTYILSDILMATSSKDPTNADGKFSDDQKRRLTAMAAEAIVSRPETERAQLAGEVGGLLAKRPEMRGTREEITRSILDQAQRMGTNRWAARMSAEETPHVTQAVR